MDGTLLYTLSTKLHFKTVKISWHIQLKLLKRKSYSLRDSASFHLAKSYIYIYIPNLHLSAANLQEVTKPFMDKVFSYLETNENLIPYVTDLLNFEENMTGIEETN
jgi:hypothetical protein